MKRREFILGSMAAAWPAMARAQGSSSPVVGFISPANPEGFAHLSAAFREGLNEQGFVDKRNVSIEYRWARGQYNQLPELATDLVARRVAVIVATGGEAVALAAHAATKTIPIVFAVGDDPVKIGLVASLNRPGGNATGVTLFSAPLAAKRLELLQKLFPKADVIGLLVNIHSGVTELESEYLQVAASANGQRAKVLKLGSIDELDAMFASLAEQRINALVVQSEPLFTSNRDRITALARRYQVAAIYGRREYCVSGGLMSYGSSQSDSYRQTGVYAGRILKGEKPSELPVLQPTKFEFVINLRTAKELGVEIPPTLLALADEVIE